MKVALSVLNGDKVNLNHQRFTVGALFGGLEQTWEFGLPTLLGHDQHRPIGWMHGLSLHFEPGEVRFTGLSFLAETVGDGEAVEKKHRTLLAKRHAEETKSFEAEIQQTFGPHMSCDATRIRTEAVSVWDRQVAPRVLPGLFGLRDKDGLVELSLLQTIAPGVFRYGGVLVFAHSFLRRNLSRLNTLNEPFLQRFQDTARDSKLQCKIALDEDMIGLDGTFKRPMELAYWWGPKFSDDLAKIPVGVSVHHADEQQRMMDGISKTELGWYMQDGRRVFEAEELREYPTAGLGHQKFGCRYVHSILDPDTNLPMHLDGAIRAYDEAEMIGRLDVDIRHAGRHAEYTKLWRLDGMLSVTQWKELVCHYYRDNHLVGEYLGGTDPVKSRVIAKRADRPKRTAFQRVIPYEMKRGSGVRLAISLDHKTSSGENFRTIEPIDSITGPNGKRYVMESIVLELAKGLKRRGEPVTLPRGAAVLSFQDRIFNLPHVRHGGPRAVQFADGTFDTIKELCEALSSRDCLLSFSLGVDYDTKAANYSFAGHAADLAIWISRPEVRLPRSENLISQWAETMGEMLTREFPEAGDEPPLAALQMHSGLLRLQRVMLEPDHFAFDFNEERSAVDIILAVPRSDKELAELVQSGVVTAASVLELKKLRCSKCKHDYLKCGCSKVLDSGVVMIVTDAQPLGAFWTNRPAEVRSRPSPA